MCGPSVVSNVKKEEEEAQKKGTSDGTQGQGGTQPINQPVDKPQDTGSQSNDNAGGTSNIPPAPTTPAPTGNSPAPTNPTNPTPTGNPSAPSQPSTTKEVINNADSKTLKEALVTQYHVDKEFNKADNVKAREALYRDGDEEYNKGVDTKQREEISQKLSNPSQPAADKKSSGWDKLENVNEWGSFGNELLGDALGITGDSMDIHSSKFKYSDKSEAELKALSPEEQAAADREARFDDAYSGTQAAAGILTGGIGMLTNSISMACNIHKLYRSGHNRIDQVGGGFGVAADTMGLLSSLCTLSGGASALGGFGKGDGDKADKAVSAFSIMGSTFGLAGSTLSATSSFIQAGMYGRAGKGNYGDINANKQEKAKYAKGSDEYKGLTAKNRKAKAAALAKSNGAYKRRESLIDGFQNSVEALGGLCTLGGGIAKAFDGLPGAGVGMGLNLLGMAIKYAGKMGGALGKKINKSRHKKKSATERKNVINNYIDGKVNKIKEEAKEGRDGKSYIINDNQAKQIAIARLGVDVEIDGSDINDDVKDKAYNKLIEKRAKNIYELSPDDKRDILSSFSLGVNATVEEIMQALGAE